MEIEHSRLLKYLMDPKISNKMEFEKPNPTSIESEVPEQQKMREATHDVVRPTDTPLSQAEKVEYDMDSYVPVITQTKETENRKEPSKLGVFKVENPMYSCIHGEIVTGPHTLRQVTDEDEQQEERSENGEKKTPNQQDDKNKREVIKADIEGNTNEHLLDKKKEDIHDEEKKPKTRIPISKFKQAAERVTEQRRAIKNEKSPESKPLNKESRVQQFSIPKIHHTVAPNKPPRLSIEKNKISPKVSHPKTLNEKIDTSKKPIKSEIGNKTDDKISKIPAIPKPVTNTVNKPQISDNIQLKDEIKKIEFDSGTILKPNETESNMNNKINPSEEQVQTHIDIKLKENILATDDAKKIQVEDEFEKLYDEIVDPAEVNLDNSLLNNKIDDPEKIENKFEDIIHAYDDPDQLEAEEVKIKSKIPQLKRRSEHEIIVPVQIRRPSLKNPPSVEKGKVHNPFKKSTNQTEAKKEIPKQKPIKKESETTKEKILSRLPFLRKVKEPKKEDIKAKQLDSDLPEPKDIKNKPKESSKTKELHTEPKNIIDETIHIRDFRQPKLRDSAPDIVETKIEEETKNEEKYEEPVKEHLKSHHSVEDEDWQKRPGKEIETVNQAKGLDKFEQIPVEKLEVKYGKPHDCQDEGKNIQNEDVDTVISFNPVENANTIEFDNHSENKNFEDRNIDSGNMDELQHKPSAHESEVEEIPIHTTKVHLSDTKPLPELEDNPQMEPIVKTEMVENIHESNNNQEPTKLDKTIKKAQEINKKINHDHQENRKGNDIPKELNKESETPETGNIEYIQTEETLILDRMEKPQEMTLLNKKEQFVERDYKVKENNDEIINKKVMKENICEKQNKTEEISEILHKKEINEDADKEREELNEGSFLNKKENVHEEFTKENKHLDDEDVPSLKGKVSNIINRIHSNNLAHVEIKKEEPEKEKPKKRSILSKIAMFEHKDSSAPVQKRTLPQHKDTKTPTYRIEVVDINKPDKPSVVGEVLKPIQREPILKQEIHQDANAIKTIDTMQNDFEQPKQLLIIEDIREYTSTICDNKNYESDIIIKENISELHDNHSVINKETKDKVKPIKTEAIPKTETMKITSILKSKDLNTNPSRQKIKQDNKEINTPKKVEKLPSIESVEQNQRKQDPKIFIPEKTDEKLNKDFKPNTPPPNSIPIDEKPVTPEINKLANEKEGYILEKQKDYLDNESLTNDVFDNNKTDTELEIINVVQRKPKKREERPKSVAEIDLGDAVKGIVHKMIVRMNSTELLNVEKKEIINAKERPRKKSVSEKIELFEKKLTPVEIKGVKNRETHAKSTPKCFQEETRISEDECQRIINDLKNAKLNYGRVTEMAYLDFNNGHTMPVLNIGTALLDKRLIPHVIEAAIDLGYRGVDTAYVYGNEKEIGEAIQAKINDGTVKREDLFITSKLWNTYHRPDLVAKACKRSLQAMGLEYFDLYLVHSPMSFKEGDDPIPKIANVIQYSAFDYMDAWYAMEHLVSEGLVRSIGVSNFNSVQIARVVEKSRIKPVVNQVECHPYLSQRNLDDFCNARDVMLNCFGTLGSKGTPDHMKTLLQPVIDDPLVKVMAAGLNVTPAQMLIRYQIENRRTVVVKATKAEHLWSNLQTLNTSLDSRQIDALDALNRNKRTYDFKGMGTTHKNYPFNRPF